MKEAQDYINEIKIRLAVSTAIAAVEIMTERTTEERGYFRVRMRLSNDDFLEASEYFVMQAGAPLTIEYRYQWMDDTQKKLIKRWDNAKHFPDLPNFPHHIHVGVEERVESGQSLSILDLLNIIEREIR